MKITEFIKHEVRRYFGLNPDQPRFIAFISLVLSITIMVSSLGVFTICWFFPDPLDTIIITAGASTICFLLASYLFKAVFIRLWPRKQKT